MPCVRRRRGRLLLRQQVRQPVRHTIDGPLSMRTVALLPKHQLRHMPGFRHVLRRRPRHGVHADLPCEHSVRAIALQLLSVVRHMCNRHGMQQQRSVRRVLFDADVRRVATSRMCGRGLWQLPASLVLLGRPRLRLPPLLPCISELRPQPAELSQVLPNIHRSAAQLWQLPASLVLLGRLRLRLPPLLPCIAGLRPQPGEQSQVLPNIHRSAAQLRRGKLYSGRLLRLDLRQRHGSPTVQVVLPGTPVRAERRRRAVQRHQLRNVCSRLLVLIRLMLSDVSVGQLRPLALQLVDSVRNPLPSRPRLHGRPQPPEVRAVLRKGADVRRVAVVPRRQLRQLQQHGRMSVLSTGQSVHVLLRLRAQHVRHA
jgi:hypothetical protein